MNSVQNKCAWIVKHCKTYKSASIVFQFWLKKCFLQFFSLEVSRFTESIRINNQSVIIEIKKLAVVL